MDLSELENDCAKLRSDLERLHSDMEFAESEEDRLSIGNKMKFKRRHLNHLRTKIQSQKRKIKDCQNGN